MHCIRDVLETLPPEGSTHDQDADDHELGGLDTCDFCPTCHRPYQYPPSALYSPDLSAILDWLVSIDNKLRELTGEMEAQHAWLLVQLEALAARVQEVKI